ncbi:MAG: 30S ribosomal protein S20 [Planctomycetes bacterium]|nr:30S ribosomal protein S20 [Planctomycetota bacterium]
MAHSLSAKKRVRQNEKRRTINRARKSQVKTLAKRFDEALTKGDTELASVELKALCRKLDKTAATSTMHKNTAARNKSRLTKRFNALQAKKGA